jgi:hypothetical protein
MNPEFGKTGGFPGNQLPPPIYGDAELKWIHTSILWLTGNHEMIYDSERVVRRAARLVPRLKIGVIHNANSKHPVQARPSPAPVAPPGLPGPSISVPILLAIVIT